MQRWFTLFFIVCAHPVRVKPHQAEHPMVLEARARLTRGLYDGITVLRDLAGDIHVR